MTQRLAIIVNPTSGGGRTYKRIKAHLDAWPHPEWSIEVFATLGAGHAGELVQELLPNPPDRLAICGGDGTIHDVVSMVPSPPFPVAILPSGTANVLAREIGIPLDPVRALEIALHGVERRLDLGFLNSRNARRFLLMTGIGFDAYAVFKVQSRVKRRIGIGAYYIAALQCLLTYHFPEFQVTTEHESIPATTCIVANARSYGGGLVLTPEASMSDGFFDLIALKSKDRLAYARFMFSAWRGKPQSATEAQTLRAQTVRVEGPRGVWVQADGELIGTLPLDIHLIPASFPLIVGRQ